MTFSIVGYCPRTRAYGMAVTSSSLCVASRCAWVRPGVGAVATQNLTNPLLGPMGLGLLSQGMAETAVLENLLASDPGRDYRQLMILGPAGRCVHHTGAQVLPIHAQAAGSACAAAGNLLADARIPGRMVAAFEARPLQALAQRLLDALHAGLAAGGETRPLQSAGVVAGDDNGWLTVDLRVDQHHAPLAELQRLWDLYEPMRAGYIERVAAPERYTPRTG